eukprot:TRINITY_DN845_c0_g1_i2.p1 TRINITY_DN845_c0_g1~~TRINITY_DN845_c0_g1_i2.p1  ORF type:complete len:343 (-),score=66.86 TRINITY_DN845_c0_g1_i2:146-1174(-)
MCIRDRVPTQSTWGSLIYIKKMNRKFVCLVLVAIFAVNIVAYKEANNRRILFKAYNEGDDGKIFLAAFSSQFGSTVQPDQVELKSISLILVRQSLQFIQREDFADSQIPQNQFYRAVAEFNEKSELESVREGLRQLKALSENYNFVWRKVWDNLDQKEPGTRNKIILEILSLLQNNQFLEAGALYGKLVKELYQYQIALNAEFAKDFLQGYFSVYGEVDRSRIVPDFQREKLVRALQKLSYDKISDNVDGLDLISQEFWSEINRNHEGLGAPFEQAVAANREIYVGKDDFEKYVKRVRIVEELYEITIAKRYAKVVRSLQISDPVEAGAIFGRLQYQLHKPL